MAVQKVLFKLRYLAKCCLQQPCNSLPLSTTSLSFPPLSGSFGGWMKGQTFYSKKKRGGYYPTVLNTCCSKVVDCSTVLNACCSREVDCPIVLYTRCSRVVDCPTVLNTRCSREVDCPTVLQSLKQCIQNFRLQLIERSVKDSYFFLR